MSHLIVCRARCTTACLHGQPTRLQFGEDLHMRDDGTYREDPRIQYPSAPGYPPDDALNGASIICDPCYVAIGQPLNDDGTEEARITAVWKRRIRVQTMAAEA